MKFKETIHKEKHKLQFQNDNKSKGKKGNIRKYIKSTTRHLNLSYISILTNLLQTVKETKSVKTIYN